MNTSNRALIGYFWRLSRGNIFSLVSLCVASAFLVKHAQGTEAAPAFAYMNLLVQVFWIVILGGCLLVQRAERIFVPPPYLLTLPVSTRRYLLMFYSYLIMVVALISSAMAVLHVRMFGNIISGALEPVTLEPWRIPLLCLGLVCMVQSLFHLTGIRNEFRFIVRSAAMVVLAFVSTLPLLDPSGERGNHALALCLLAMALAWSNSYAAITAHRCGRGGTGLWERVLALLDRGEGRTQPFANPKKALFWFGWRRHGRMLAGCGLFFCAVGLAFGLCSQDFWYGPPGQQFTVLLAFAGIPVILTGGLVGTLLIFIRDGEDFYSGGRGFFLTLPARSVDMARQRLYASAAGIGVIMAGMSAIMLLLSPLAIESSETVGSVILLLLAAAGGAWVGMWFLVPGALLFVATAVALAVSAFVFSVVFRVDNVMTAGAALAAIAFAVIAWRKLPDRINTIVLALVACGTLLVLGQLIANGYELRTLNYVVVLLVPAPLAVLPLALDWWRHR